MTRRWLFAACLVLLPLRASAQMFGMGQEDEWGDDKPRELVQRQTILPYAVALEASFSTATWTTLKVSTHTAAELTRLMYRGFYRQELLQLVLLAQKAKVPLDEVVRRRDKGAAMRTLASDYKVDGEALAQEAEEKRAALDLLEPKISTTTLKPPLLPGTTAVAPIKK